MTMKNYNKINKTYIHADAALYTTKEEIDSINEAQLPQEPSDGILIDTHN